MTDKPLEDMVERLKEGCIDEFHGPGCGMNWPKVDRVKTDRLMQNAANTIERLCREIGALKAQPQRSEEQP